MKRRSLFLLVVLIIVIGCEQPFEPVGDVFTQYEGESVEYGFELAKGREICKGIGLTISDRGNNEVIIFAGCSILKPELTVPKFDNLFFGKSTVDTVRVPDPPRQPFLRKNVKYGLFAKSTGRQVAYIAFERRYTNTNPPHSYQDTYYLYIPYLVSTTGDVLTNYFGRREYKEVLK